jgi:hypothetical protein
MTASRTEPVARPRSEDVKQMRERRRRPRLRLRWTPSAAGLAAQWSLDEQ